MEMRPTGSGTFRAGAGMDSQQQFCLKWNSFGSNLASVFSNLFKSENLADVTLFCDGVSFKAHKLILAACSKHLAELFENAPIHQNVCVILDGTSAANLAALLEFMYKGEVHVAQESLTSFLKAAEYLQVKGLSIEHEKLAVAHSHKTNAEATPGATVSGGGVATPQSLPHQSPHHNLESPASLRKHNVRNLSSSSETLKDECDTSHAVHHATSSLYSPAMVSPYSVYSHHYRNTYAEQQRLQQQHHQQQQNVATSSSNCTNMSPSGYDLAGKITLRSPSEMMPSPQESASAIRQSVLRNGRGASRSGSPSCSAASNGPLGYSPPSLLALAYHRPSSTSSLPPAQPEADAAPASDKYDPDGACTPTAAAAAAAAAAASSSSTPPITTTTTFDRPGLDESNGGADVRRNSSMDMDSHSRPEDLRVKMELSSPTDEIHSTKSSNSNELSPPPPNGIMFHKGQQQQSPSILNATTSLKYDLNMMEATNRDAMPTSLWNAVTGKLSHKTGTSVNTADGKKLKCPFCERLYGYETNLRAHIRQRHQGIRVPCPFCSRTFTRNNTVRRHIAREHKQELSLKVQHEPQIFNQ